MFVVCLLAAELTSGTAGFWHDYYLRDIQGQRGAFIRSGITPSLNSKSSGFPATGVGRATLTQCFGIKQLENVGLRTKNLSIFAKKNSTLKRQSPQLTERYGS